MGGAMLVGAEEYRHLLAWHAKARQHDYEVARWICYSMMQQLPYVRHKPGTLTSYARFSWEKPAPSTAPVPRYVTPEEVSILYGMLQDFMDRRRRS